MHTVQDVMILFYNGEVLVRPDTGDLITVPPDFPGLLKSGPYEIGLRDNVRYFASELAGEEPLPEAGVPAPLRRFAGPAKADMFTLVSRGSQLLYWANTYRMCPRCGRALSDMPADFGKECTACRLHFFPPISPAIIVGVVKEDKLLLAHNVRFKEDIHSLVAGFVEPGETIEECARREVLEETSVRIAEIRYFGSQTWPFPHSLMIGLTAEYAGGDIEPDGVEIDRAGWFSKDELPPIPGPGSISRRIIDWFRGREE